MKVVGVIPARYASTRLPGKPLMDICGKPMLVWVYEQVKKAKKLDEVYVATDDSRIEDMCRQHEIPVVMTSTEHRTGANRLQEVSESIQADFYVQLNGDEPLLDPDLIDAAVPDTIITEEEFGTNIITTMENPSEVLDAANIKMVFDDQMRAMYMSRTPIPYPFKSIEFEYYKHVGILGYNKKMLDFYKNSEPGRWEKIEGIDTMRFLDYGKTLQLIKVDHCHTLSVDTPKDLERVRQMMAEKLNKEVNHG
ncbi:MAG TPA: 3-deoxy-manno-octulosonate cytidylyltransferase [Candidatus Blautia gallistercoris]|uniref:3-deoxy-manno-octulosonate cytidylyltransferase n=1 Tax=Candidatus Blautia gallistercoris TaxID=2838490 RepID=A0A9D1WJK2_9FIRM|nr:3-deoxy-manno-octulosonate cytidylyltransferase [Candidatus Blautia gallistercoris]